MLTIIIKVSRQFFLFELLFPPHPQTDAKASLHHWSVCSKGGEHRKMDHWPKNQLQVSTTS